jgi:hypothetical protein
MKTTTTVPLAEIRQHRLGLRIAARLTAGTADLPHDVLERLRAARERALAHAKRPVIATVPQSAGHATVLGQMGGAAVLGGLGGLGHFGTGQGSERDGMGWWSHIVSIAVALALMAGRVAIARVQGDEHASEVANVDSALLTDDLPPRAYADPGFAQFLKTNTAPSASPHD